MKLFKQIFIILIVFFKTGNLLSENNLFNVNTGGASQVGRLLIYLDLTTETYINLKGTITYYDYGATTPVFTATVPDSNFSEPMFACSIEFV